MALLVGDLEARQIERFRSHLAEVLAVELAYPRFYDYHALALRARPLDREKRQEIGDYLRSVSFADLARVDARSPEARRYIEHILGRYIQINPDLQSVHQRRYVPYARAQVPRLAAAAHRVLVGLAGDAGAPTSADRPDDASDGWEASGWLVGAVQHDASGSRRDAALAEAPTAEWQSVPGSLYDPRQQSVAGPGARSRPSTPEPTTSLFSRNGAPHESPPSTDHAPFHGAAPASSDDPRSDLVIFGQLRHQVEAYVRRAALSYGVRGAEHDVVLVLGSLRRSGMVDEADLRLVEQIIATTDRVGQQGYATHADYRQALMLYLLYHRSHLGA